MPKDVKNEWMDAPAEDLLAPKSLDEIGMDRQQASDEAVLAPAPAPAPMPQPAAELPKPDPISDKDLAKLLEDSAKALLDAALNIDKSNTNLKKILTKLNYSGDSDVQTKVDTIVNSMTEMKDNVQAMSEAITGYRQDKISEEAPIL
jgi:hypothetical protein